jgi:AcrR family transcriptional regulator
MGPRDDDQGTAILEAASRLLMDEGAGALTVRRIAAEAGCSTMGLYSRFGGKDGVVDRLYVQGFEYLCDAMSDLPKTDDPLADLRLCARIYRATALDHAAHYMIMFGRAVPGFRPSDESHDVAHDAFERLVRRVQRCIDAGVFAGDAKKIAEILWGSMHGLVMLELVGVNPLGDDPAERYERSLDALCDGLRVESQRGVT